MLYAGLDSDIFRQCGDVICHIRFSVYYHVVMG